MNTKVEFITVDNERALLRLRMREMTIDYQAHQYTCKLSAGTYMCEFIGKTMNTNGHKVSGDSRVDYLEWDPSFGKDGGWFTSRNILIAKKDVYRIAKHKSKHPEADLIIRQWATS